MLGAIIGDIIGSPYEYTSHKSTDFLLFTPGSKFTDDTVMTVAVADCILHDLGYAKTLKEYGRRYPSADFGKRFRNWLFSDEPQPSDSWGNGAAMRVSPVGFAFNSLKDVLREAERTALPSHNHPQSIAGAQATAAAIFLARTGSSKKEIRSYLESEFDYDLHRPLDEIRPTYRFSEKCIETVPEAIIAFLESTDYEDAVRKAISLGGDADHSPA